MVASKAQKEAVEDVIIVDGLDEEIVEVVDSGVSEDMQAAAKADLDRLNEQRAAGPKLRVFKSPDSPSELYVSELYEFPAEFDLEGIGPTSYLAQVEGEITGSIHTQTFSIREERLKGLMFEQPNRKLEAGRSLRVVKAIKPNGGLVQLPFESRVNNAAAGEVGDVIGLRTYQRKRFILLMDVDTLSPVYCFARNCWAAAMVPQLVAMFPQHSDVVGSGYCAYDHMVFTEPNLGRQASLGTFGQNATTSQSWERRD
jgi:hypothetical protein